MDDSTPQIGHHMSTVVVPKGRSPTSRIYIGYATSSSSSTIVLPANNACSNKEIVSDTINHTTGVNDQSSSDPAFAMINESSNEYDTSFLSGELDLPADIPCSTHMQTYVMAKGASTKPKSLAEAKVTTDKGVPASAITRFPMEVIGRIIKYCMTPNGGKFEMPGLTMAEYKPGINTKVLLAK